MTETPEIVRALDAAALAWPELRGDRTALLRNLIEAGRASVEVEGGVHDLIVAAAGAATGAYPSAARAALLDEWPE